MSTRLEELKAKLSSLSVSERADLAQYLLHSLDVGKEGIKAEWLALAEGRMADVHAGRVVGIPAEEVLKNLLEPGP